MHLVFSMQLSWLSSKNSFGGLKNGKGHLCKNK